MKQPELSRRELLIQAAGAAAALHLPPAGSADPVDLRWLEGGVPELTAGVTWGVPWPRGAFAREQTFALQTERGESVPVQTWPLARWPDGSLKWTAHAIGADAGRSERLRLVPGAPAAPARAVSVRDTAEAVEIDTGAIRCRVPKRGVTIIDSITRDGREIARGGHLVCLRQDRPEADEDGALRQERFTGRIERVAIEQRGPVRAVVKIEGRHEGPARRAWLPFTVRLVFTAGGDALRIVHTFVFDGDENRDFLRGLGVRFAVPMPDALHDRHVRFAGEGAGLWAEAVRGLTGLRRDPGPAVREAQVAGRATPPVEAFPPAVRAGLERIPAWGDYTLAQLSADGFAIRKRTKPGHGWIPAAAGRRAAGLGYVGGPSGGVAFGLRDFWQRHPTQLDIRGAAGDAAEVTLWLWSPDAPAMDLRFYHDGMGMNTYAEQNEGLDITYEDYEPGWGTPQGIARTSELTLWALAATPPRERLAAMADAVRTPPLLACRPERLLAAGVFGALWSLPDRSTPARARIEDQLDYLLDLFRKQIEERRWYGFWNYGDVMHSYDPDRHEWRYDVGGFAWANSELSPDLWLWYSYLRTGRSDVFRMAEAMTRHTGEVDVHHLGRFRGLGSRHNVLHWGDSSKQPRVSTAAYRRFLFYLSADERVGDLLREQLDTDRRLTEIIIGRKVGAPRTGVPRTGVPSPYPAHAGFGTDWCSFAAAWLTEWERTGDTRWRDKILAGMRTIGALPRGWLAGGAGYDPDTGRFLGPGDRISVSHLNAVFGAVEINAELLQLLDVPEYERTWLQYCELYNAGAEEQQRQIGQRLSARNLNLGEAHSRLTAYAAQRKNDPQLAARAWREFFGGAAGLGVRTDLSTRRIEGPAVLNPVDEGFGMSTNAASQWGLAAIQNLALIGEHIPAPSPGPSPVPGEESL